MDKRILVIVCLVSIMSVGAFAVGFIGTPTAELKQGQWSGGYSYMYSDMDLDKTKMKYSGYDAEEDEDYSGTEGLKIKDFKTQRHYATIGYGLTDAWEAYLQLGIADVKSKTKWEDDDEWCGLNFDNDFAWGWGTRVTFHEQDSVRWGASLQMNWLDTSWDWEGYYGEGDYEKETLDLEVYDLLIAVGPTVDMGGWKLYGGPFYYYLSGDLDDKWSDSEGGYGKATGDLEADSNFGGFIGAKFALNENLDMTTEFSLTGDGWAFGTAFGWKF